MPHDDAQHGSHRSSNPEARETLQLAGIGASPGTAIGRAWLYQPAEVMPRGTRPNIAVSAEQERDRLHTALKGAVEALLALAKRVRDEVGEAESDIFTAQALMLDDPTISERAETLINEDGKDAATALTQAAEEQAQLMEALPDPLFQARAADVRDAARRAVAMLNVGGNTEPTALSDRISALADPVILIAQDLAPSDSVQLPLDKVRAIATALGSTTSHAAILARARGIPAVVGLGPRLFADVRTGDQVILDGRSGDVFVNPSAAQVAAAQVAETERNLARETVRRTATASRSRGQTRDGHPVPLLANVGSQVEAQLAAEEGAEGIGLLRTEFVFAERAAMPSAEEQAEIYRAIIEPFSNASHPVIIRTLDAGADKPLPALQHYVEQLPQEANPALGVRGIRLQLRYPELLHEQLVGVQMAAAGSAAHTQVMLPMVSTLGELTQGVAALEAAHAEYAQRVGKSQPKILLGIMIETPAAVLTSDVLAAHAAFFSIGTNDLTQYLMSADRLNPQLAALAQPLQPAVLRAIGQVVEAANKVGIPVGVCGEMAGEPSLALLLIGLGVSDLSMAPGNVAAVREALAARTLSELRKFAEQVLRMQTPDDVKEAMDRFQGAK